MKTLLTLVLLLLSSLLQAQESPAAALWPDVPADTVTTYENGSVTLTEGTVGGKILRMESNRTGGTTLSTGSLGAEPIDTFTVRLDRNIELTSGTVGTESVEAITVSPDKD